jgi:hypothetical protein
MARSDQTLALDDGYVCMHTVQFTSGRPQGRVNRGQHAPLLSVCLSIKLLDLQVSQRGVPVILRVRAKLCRERGRVIRLRFRCGLSLSIVHQERFIAIEPLACCTHSLVLTSVYLCLLFGQVMR